MAPRPFLRVDGVSLNDSNALELFIGASNSDPGLLFRAEGGTLFISDLQDLGPRAQSLLLGFLEHGSAFPAGSSEARKIDVRFIGSMQPLIGDNLRADLLSAMGVMQLNIPPLRDRSEDVPGLLKQYVDRLVDKEGFSYRRFNFAAQNRLRNYPWPGNLRELHNLVRRLLLAGGSEEIGLQEVESNLSPTCGGFRASGWSGFAWRCRCARRVSNSNEPTLVSNWRYAAAKLASSQTV